MTGSRSSHPSALGQDLEALTREAGALAQSLSQETRLAGEEAVGAELVATRELVAHLGIVWDTVEQLNALGGRQLRYFARDHLDTLSALLGAPATGDPATLLTRLLNHHCERRLAHLAEGFEGAVEVLSAQSDKAWDALFELWSPFFSVIRQDWARQRSRAGA